MIFGKIKKARIIMTMNVSGVFLDRHILEMPVQKVDSRRSLAEPEYKTKEDKNQKENEKENKDK